MVNLLMAINADVKNQFIKNFQNKILQGRQLLQNNNHRWGDKIFTNLYYDIEKIDWIEDQKKRQFIMIITNSWWIYLNSLISRKEEGAKIDFIRYIDAYNRFFSFLSKLDEFDLFSNFWTVLLKNFIKKKELSVDGITKFVNSFCTIIKEREIFLKLVELQIILTFLRKSVFPSDLFRLSLKILGEILFKLEPSKKALFLFVFMENVNIEYMGNDPEFLQLINKSLANRLPNYLKEDFANMRKISINERNFSSILADLEEIIFYLNDIGENTWIIIVLKYLFSKMNEFQSFEEAVIYIRKFIDYSMARSQFHIAYGIYDFLEDIFMYKTDLGYDNFLIELWVEACKKFMDKKDNKYLLMALEKLNNHLKNPQTAAQIYHYFYTCNYLWKFKSKLFYLDSDDFWRMMFYRTLYEENDFALAEKIIPYLDDNLKPHLTDLNSLYNESESLKSITYSFGDEFEIIPASSLEFELNQMILRINGKGLVSYHIIVDNNKIIEGTITNEFWNDLQIMDIYNDLFSGIKDKRYKFSLPEFGRLLFIFLPKSIRNFFKKVRISSVIPQIYLILDNMSIPLGLIYDDNFFMLKYSSGYKIGEPTLVQTVFEHSFADTQSQLDQKKYNVLLIEAVNASGPLKWNEVNKTKELIYPFPVGTEEYNHMANYFNEQAEINQITVLNGFNTTRQKILSSLSNDPLNIIHIVCNIFYSELSPKDSYLLTNDDDLITFDEIKSALDKNSSNQRPILFFNAQIFNIGGKRQKNVLRTFGEIVSQFNYDSITGIITRNYPLFNHETREVTTSFYNNLFKNYSQGIALLNARRQSKSGLAISSFLLFGKPWKKL